MSNQHIAAVFDVDGTLLTGDSLERIFFNYLWRYGEIGWREMARLAGGACGALTGCAALADRKAYLRGHEFRHLKRLARDCFEQEMIRRLLPDALARLRWHQRAGHEVILLSGTLDVLLEPLAEYLEVSTRIGTTIEISGLRLTGRLASTRPFGPAKVTCLKQMLESRQPASINLTRSFAYGDHYADRFLLAATGHPVATNPDRRLRHLAEKRGWMIENFA